jgi:hypothetical protein
MNQFSGKCPGCGKNKSKIFKYCDDCDKCKLINCQAIKKKTNKLCINKTPGLFCISHKNRCVHCRRENIFMNEYCYSCFISN